MTVWWWMGCDCVEGREVILTTITISHTTMANIFTTISTFMLFPPPLHHTTPYHTHHTIHTTPCTPHHAHHTIHTTPYTPHQGGHDGGASSLWSRLTVHSIVKKVNRLLTPGVVGETVVIVVEVDVIVFVVVVDVVIFLLLLMPGLLMLLLYCRCLCCCGTQYTNTQRDTQHLEHFEGLEKSLKDVATYVKNATSLLRACLLALKVTRWSFELLAWRD